MPRLYTPSVKKKKEESAFHIYWRKMDKPLILVAFLCSLISVILLYSIWKNNILSTVGSSYYITQITSCAIGVLAVLLLVFVDYRKLIKLWFIYAPIALVLVLLTFTSLGLKRSGADDQAWLNLGFLQFQPSEVLKLAFILTFALHLSKVEDKLNHPLNILLLCIHGAVPTGIVALQGDYGTAIVFAFIFICMLFAMRLNWKYILGFLILIPVACVLAWNFLLGETHKKRILVLLNPGSDPENIEYQQDKGLAALANGKVFGVGLFKGQDAYVSVPELHNDFMFAQVGQAFGFAGAIIVIILLAFLCLRCLFDGQRAADTSGRILCVGVFALLFIHCFLNIGMVLKVMPVIGVPLPFISAGGTASVSMYIALGMVVSVYAHPEEKRKLVRVQS